MLGITAFLFISLVYLSLFLHCVSFIHIWILFLLFLHGSLWLPTWKLWLFPSVLCDLIWIWWMDCIWWVRSWQSPEISDEQCPWRILTGTSTVWNLHQWHRHVDRVHCWWVCRWHQTEWCSWHSWGMGCHLEGPSKAGEVSHGTSWNSVRPSVRSCTWVGQCLLSTQAETGRNWKQTCGKGFECLLLLDEKSDVS